MDGRKIRDAAEARSLQAWRLNLARQEQPTLRFVELVPATP